MNPSRVHENDVDLSQAPASSGSNPVESVLLREDRDDGLLNEDDSQASTLTPHHLHNRHISIDLPRIQVRAPTDTPHTRTGPPRSLSFAYSLPSSPSYTRTSIRPDGFFSSDSGPDIQDRPGTGDFRSALERLGVDSFDRRGKRRETRNLDESWTNAPRRLRESPI